MQFVPLIYFSILTYYFWQKHKVIDLAVYISGLFVITSLCCVLMVAGGHLSADGGVLFDGWEPTFGVVPTVLYCGLVTLTIFPFSFIRPEKMENISNVHRFVIYGFTLFVIAQGLITFYLVGGFITDVLSGDFKALKDSYYSGDISPADAKMLTMPLPVQVMSLLVFMTLLALPLFFYYSCVEKRSLWITSPLLAVSLSPVLRAILVADRTEVVHYGLMFFFCLVFFQKFITRKVRNFFVVASIPAIAVALIYFIAVSSSRFENEDEGTGGTLIEYAGQSYANFCYFYDNHNPELFYIERELPVTSFFIFKNQYVDTKGERTAREGFFVGVFASHVGSWLLDTGVVGAILISILYAVVCCVVIGRYNRTEFDIGDVFMIFALGAVPTFGIFYYRYYTVAMAFVYVAAIGFYILSKYIFVWGHNDVKETEEA